MEQLKTLWQRVLPLLAPVGRYFMGILAIFSMLICWCFGQALFAGEELSSAAWRKRNGRIGLYVYSAINALFRRLFKQDNHCRLTAVTNKEQYRAYLAHPEIESLEVKP